MTVIESNGEIYGFTVRYVELRRDYIHRRRIIVTLIKRIFVQWPTGVDRL